jgi:antitoxin PrlF
MSKAYSLRSTKIGNSNGFRLPAEFYRDNPQFTDADGWIEVISDTIAVIKIDPPDLSEGEAEDSLMIRLFLDFALTSALKNQELKPYTVEMSAIARALTEGVELDEDE